MSAADGGNKGPTGQTPEGIPWLDAAFLRLVEARVAGTLAHGLLLCGPAGVGKRRLAALLGDAWLCESELGSRTHGSPCGHCRGCQLTRAGNHPDLQRVEPAEGKATIAVDQIRELADHLALHSHAGGSRVAVVVPADAMTISAQNSLLKTLEEPSEGVILLLVADRAQALAATIRSRCQVINLPVPGAEDSRAWLQATTGASAQDTVQALELAGGAPLLARELIDDGFAAQATELGDTLARIAKGQLEPVEVAGRWEKLAIHRVLTWWQRGMNAVARATIISSGEGANPGEVDGHHLPQSYRSLAGLLAGKVDIHALFTLTDRLGQARTVIDGSINRRLLLESLLIEWATVTRPLRARSRARR